MQHHETEFRRRNVNIVVLTFEAGFIAKAYIEDTGLGWPLLVDATREVYRSYDMLEAGFWDIWGVRTLWAYAKELAHGNLPRKSEGDISQRGGDVLVDPAGIVRLHHVGKGPADRPSPHRILDVLDEQLGKRS